MISATQFLRSKKMLPALARRLPACAKLDKGERDNKTIRRRRRCSKLFSKLVSQSVPLDNFRVAKTAGLEPHPKPRAAASSFGNNKLAVSQSKFRGAKK